MEKNIIFVDVKFRCFLLERLMQELTFFDIKNAVAIDGGKRISDTRLREILQIFADNRIIKKTRMHQRHESGSLLSFIITSKGLKKLEYYKNKLRS